MPVTTDPPGMKNMPLLRPTQYSRRGDTYLSAPFGTGVGRAAQAFYSPDSVGVQRPANLDGSVATVVPCIRDPPTPPPRADEL